VEVVAGAVGVAALLVVLLVAVGYVSRLRTLTGRVGSFSCNLRSGPTASWTSGIAQYRTMSLEWWRVMSLSPRAERSWSRSALTLLDREPTSLTDDRGRPLLLVRCEHRGMTFELLMSDAACAGLVSWLEAGPSPTGRVV